MRANGVTRPRDALREYRRTVGRVLIAMSVGAAVAAAPSLAEAFLMAQAESGPAKLPAPAQNAEQPKTEQSKAEREKTGTQPLDNVEPLSSTDAASMLGKKVKGPTGEDLGLIVNVLVDKDGHPRAAVIDFGGFLGVGSRKIAIDWKALDFTSLGRAGTAELGLDRAQIAAAPEYKSGAEAMVVMAHPAPTPPVDVHK